MHDDKIKSLLLGSRRTAKKFNYLVLQARGHQEGGEGPPAEVQEGKRGKTRV